MVRESGEGGMYPIEADGRRSSRFGAGDDPDASKASALAEGDEEIPRRPHTRRGPERHKRERCISHIPSAFLVRD